MSSRRLPRTVLAWHR